MYISGITMTGLALGAVSIAWLHYLRLIPKEKVPRRPWGHAAIMLAGIGAALMGLFWESTAPTIASGGAAIALAALFLWLLSIATLPTPAMTVRVGEPLPPIRATLPNGDAWSSASLQGKATLLKVFRGSW